MSALRSLARLASRAALVAAVGGVAYSAIALARVRRFARRAPHRSAWRPGVTVLKPLHGDELELEANLESFLRQSYPAYQVLFCATEERDPAIAAARRVIERFPHVDAAVVVRAAADARNPKIANLLNAEGSIKHDVVVIADADMRVGCDYLDQVVAPLEDATVGAVTCLYGGSPAGGFASSLAAMHVNDFFAPSVLIAQALEPLGYCFGATMALRRSTLERIGGLAALGDTIADDHRLGTLVIESGLRVALSGYVVANVMHEPTLASLWARELRWARTIRAMRPVGSTLSVVSIALPLAVLAWTMAPRSPLRLGLVVAASLLRAMLHVAGRAAFAPQAPLTPHLIPVRDALTIAIWAASRTGGEVTWRERALRLGDGGALLDR